MYFCALNNLIKCAFTNCYQEKQMALARISQLKAIIDALKDQEEPIISLDPITKEYRLCPINDCRLLKSVKNKVSGLTSCHLKCCFCAHVTKTTSFLTGNEERW